LIKFFGLLSSGFKEGIFERVKTLRYFLIIFFGLNLFLFPLTLWADDRGNDPGEPDKVYFEATGMHSADGDTLYMSPNILPWDVNVDIKIETDNGISGVSVPFYDICYDASTMPTYLDPNKNDPDSCTPNAYTGTAIENFSIVASNLYGVTPTSSPPNFLIGAVHFTDSFGVTGVMQSYDLAHLTFTIPAGATIPGCLCLDTIPGAFQPGGGTFSMTTPGAVIYIPGFDESICCFVIAERFNTAPDLTCPTSVDGFGGDLITFQVGYDDLEDDVVTCGTCTVLSDVGCGACTMTDFPGGEAGTATFEFNSAGYTESVVQLEVCFIDEFTATACCTIDVNLIYVAGFVSIAHEDFAAVGDVVYLPIYLQNFVEFGGFKILVKWDPNVLTLHDVIRGDCIDEIDFNIGPHNPHYKFEEFMYEWLPCTEVHKRKIKVVGIGDLPDGYQGYPIAPHQEECVLFYLKFEIKNDATLKGLKLPVIFEWDVGIWDENTFSDPTGYVWFVSADSTQFPYDPTVPNYEIRKLLYFFDGGIRVNDNDFRRGVQLESW